MISEIDLRDAKEWPKARILRTGSKYTPFRIESNQPRTLFGFKLYNEWCFENFAETLEEAEAIAEALTNPIVKEYK